MKTGTYVMQSGPCFETPAEVRFLNAVCIFLFTIPTPHILLCFVNEWAFIYLFIYLFTHSFIYLFIHSSIDWLIYSFFTGWCWCRGNEHSSRGGCCCACWRQMRWNIVDNEQSHSRLRRPPPPQPRRGDRSWKEKISWSGPIVAISCEEDRLRVVIQTTFIIILISVVRV